MNDAPRFFYGRPLVLAALGLCTGICAGRYVLGMPGLLLTGALFFAGILCALFRKKRIALLAIACAAGLIRILIAYPTLPQPAQGGVLTGTICDFPTQTGISQRVTLRNAAYAGKPINGRVQLTIAQQDVPLTYAQSIAVEASLSLPQGARNEGGLDARLYYFTKGISCTAYAKTAADVLSQGNFGLYGHLLMLRQNTTARIVQMIGTQTGPLAAAMLHGDDASISVTELAAFRASGIAHLLAVSGLHVSLLVSVLLMLLRKAHPRVQLTLIVAFLLFYCMFTAFSASTVRASVMAVCMLSARVLGRRNDLLCSLAFACILLLLVSPFSLFAAGFQLSFCAVIGIALLSPVFSDAWQRWPAMLREALGVSIAAQLGTLPATAAHFNRLPALATFANLLVVPLAPLVVLPTGISLLLYPLLPRFATAVAHVADGTLQLMGAVASAVASTGTLFIPSPSLAACALFFLALLFASPFCLAPIGSKRLLCGCSAALCLLIWMLPRLLLPSAHITVLDVPYGYVAHVHSAKSDTLISTTSAMRSSTVTSYLEYNGIMDATMQTGNGAGATFALDGHNINIVPGGVEIDGVLYPTAANGQLRIWATNGALYVQAYAREQNYGILGRV